MTTNNPMPNIEHEISLTQLWLPKPDVCDIDEAHMTARLKWHNQYEGAGIDVTVENGDDDAISKWVIRCHETLRRSMLQRIAECSGLQESL